MTSPTWAWLLSVTLAYDAGWLDVDRMRAFDPGSVTQWFEGGAHANGGVPRLVPLATTDNPSFEVRADVDTTGEFQNPVRVLLYAAQTGVPVWYRYRHQTSIYLSFEGQATVAASRTDTSVDGVEFFRFAMTGIAPRTRVT